MAFSFFIVSHDGYAAFAVLFGLIFLFGCILMSRPWFIHFFPEKKTDPVVLLYITLMIECFYQFMTTAIVSGERKRDWSPVNFYLFTSFIPILLHLLLLSLILVYYSTHFHKEYPMILFKCGKDESPLLNDVLMYFTAVLTFIGFLILIIALAVKEKNGLDCMVGMIALFGIIALLYALFATGLIIKDWMSEKPTDNNLLVSMFAGISSALFILIFLFHFCLAVEWDTTDGDGMRGLKSSEFTFEFLLILFDMAILTYINKELILSGEVNKLEDTTSEKKSLEVAQQMGNPANGNGGNGDEGAPSTAPPPPPKAAGRGSTASASGGPPRPGPPPFQAAAGQNGTSPPPIPSHRPAVPSGTSYTIPQRNGNSTQKQTRESMGEHKSPPPTKPWQSVQSASTVASASPPVPLSMGRQPPPKHRPFTMTPKTQALVSETGKQEFSQLPPAADSEQQRPKLPPRRSIPQDLISGAAARKMASKRASENIGSASPPQLPTRNPKVNKSRSKTVGDMRDTAGMIYNKGEKVAVWDDDEDDWLNGEIARTEQQGRVVTVRLDEISKGSPFRKIDLGATPENIHKIGDDKDMDEARHRTDSSRVDLVKRRSKMRPPPTIEDFMSSKSRKKNLAKRPLPAQPQFACDPGQLKATELQDYTAPIPNILIMLANRMKQFDGLIAVGIFCNGYPVNSEQEPPRFMRGTVSEIDVSTYQSMTETDELDKFDFATLPTDYCGQLFAELLKSWFELLPTPLLQQLAEDTFEKALNSNRFNVGFGLRNKLSDFNISIFYWLLDLCNSVLDSSEQNSMDGHRLGQTFAPFLYTSDDPMNGKILRPIIAKFFGLCLDSRRESGKSFRWE